MVIELRFFKKMKNMDKMWKSFLCISHITLLPILYTGCFSHALYPDINEIESENEEYPYIWLSMGIDHSNPYIHSTTILCDTV